MLSSETTYSAWNPGLTSQIPTSLKSAITLFRSENSSVDYQTIRELADASGLKPAELVAFRVERLIIHDLLVRVTSDLSVPDGPNYEDLGISLRSMVDTIYRDYLLPEIESFQQAFSEARCRCESFIANELDQHLFTQPAKVNVSERKTFLSWLLGPKKSTSTDLRDSEMSSVLSALNHWQQCIDNEPDALRSHCLSATYRVVNAIVGHRGHLMNQSELVTTIATNMAMNQVGSELVAGLVEPVFAKAVEREQYRWLPDQKHPVVMNVKGASASGKSTIRPQQRQLAKKLNIMWEDFALISPDYWRKYLLDYDSLGDNYKYAAMLTGQELEIVDRKLDEYVAGKAARAKIPHLLIDRFRFDSFSVDAGKSQDSKLLSRFGDHIYLFFMITPPAETVVRAWQRGRTTGRFKAVDDLLYHNIEAYTGMPELFLSWVLSSDKTVCFEFLDNNVPKGEPPNTVAFGSNNTMTILDIVVLRNIDRYRRVNINADCSEQVLIEDTEADNESTFINRCVRSIKNVRFAEQSTGTVYAIFEGGGLLWWEPQLLQSQPGTSELIKIVESGNGKPDLQFAPQVGEEVVAQHTLGRWADSSP